MAKVIIKRILQSIPILLLVITIAFLLTRAIPGDPVLAILGDQATEEAYQMLYKEMGMDKSTVEQYIAYVTNILKGDFGKSYVYNEEIIDLIMDRLPNTLLISLTSLAIAIILGLIIGTISAVKQYSSLDYTTTLLALVGVSIPRFWLALMLVLIFSVKLGWLPALGMGSIANGLGDVISHMVLPCLCLIVSPAATFTRMTRSSMLEVINSNSIKALRARGIKEKRILFIHALKNALPPIVTVFSLQLAASVTGAIITETIFSWPGMGTLIMGAINNRDFSLIQGSVLLIAIAFVFVNLLADIVYMLINPKYSKNTIDGGI